MNTKKMIGTALLSTVLLFANFGMTGCGAKSAKDEINADNKTTAGLTDETAPEIKSPGEETYNAAPVSTEQQTKDKEASVPVANDKVPAMIIKTADISMQVEKYDGSRSRILDIIKKHNAYVGSENQTNNHYNISNIMVIRVKAADFDALVEELLKEAIYVESKKINAEDVTAEFVDVNARLKSKKEAEAQYLDIMKKARTINEILDVQQYLRTIREEIESYEGRLKYLNDKVSYSTVNLSFYEKSNALQIEPGRSFGSRFVEALDWGWKGLVSFFLGLIYIWPLLLITIIGLWLMARLIKRAKKRRALKKTNA
jgi:hypothetical protein